jgi:hypothetical protein
MKMAGLPSTNLTRIHECARTSDSCIRDPIRGRQPTLFFRADPHAGHGSLLPPAPRRMKRRHSSFVVFSEQTIQKANEEKRKNGN